MMKWFAIFPLSVATAFGQINPPTNLHPVGNDFSWVFSRQTVSIVISWKDNTGLASSNLVQHSTDGGSTWSTIVTQPVGNNAAGEEIPIGLTYQYRVQSLYNGSSSAFCPPIAISALEPPSQYTFWSTNTGTVNIHFVSNGTETGPNIPYCTNYALEVSTNGFSTFSTISLPNASGGNPILDYIITSNFLAGVTYAFQIRLVNSTNNTRSVVNERWGPVSLAPNAAPPAPWHFFSYALNASDTGSGAPSVVEFFSDDNSLTELGFKVDRSADNGATWTQVTTTGPSLFTYYGRLNWAGGNSYFDDHNLTPGQNYLYRISATNSLGSSSYVTNKISLPSIVSGTIQDGYVDPVSGIGGNNSGTSWANAWANPESINWVRIGPGSRIHIGGGDYTPGFFNVNQSGTANNFINFLASQEAGHNTGVYCHGGGINMGTFQYVSFEGRINTNLAWNGLTPYNITNNINWHLLTNFGGAISTSAGNGFQIRGIEIAGAGFLYTNLGETIPLGSKASGVLYNSDNYFTNAELAYCYIHDVTDYAFNPNFGQARLGDYLVHDNVMTRYYGGIMRGGSMDFYRNICGPIAYPGTEHGNGLACSPNNQRIYDNIFYGGNASVLYANTHGVNPNYNFYYYNNSMYMGPGVFNDGAGAFEFTCSEQTGFISYTNVVVVFNTIYKVCPEAMVSTSAGNGFGMTNWLVENNIIVSPDDGSTSDTAVNLAAFPPSLSDTNNFRQDFNIVTRPTAQISYYGTLYADALAMNTATAWTHNSTNLPSFWNTTNFNFRLKSSDTAALGKGTNLTALSATMPGINLDANGMPRGNSIGAFGNLDPSLLLWIDFAEGAITSSTPDASGYTNTAFNLNTTNQVLLSTLPLSGLPCGFWGKAYPDGFGFSLGPYLAITNYQSFNILSNGTMSARTAWDTNSGFTSSILDGGFGETPPQGGASWRFFRNQDTRVYLTLWTNSTDINSIVFPDDTVGGGNLSQTNEAMLTVTWTSDGTNLLMVGYYDGQPFKTNTAAGVPFLSVDSLNHWVAAGCWHHNNPDTPTPPNGPNNGWVGGKMGDIRIYGRALSAGEVNAIYQSPQLVLGSSGSFASGVTDPTITVQPQNQTVSIGQSATFSVGATGNSPLSYQWRFNGVVVGGNSSSYTRSNCQSGDNNGQVQATVTDMAGSVMSAFATLSVDPIITSQPNNQSVSVGQTASFSITLTTVFPPLTYQWKKNGSTISGATQSTYATPSTVIGDNGSTFLCIACNNSGGCITSSSATLTVNQDPTIIIQPQSQTVVQGNNVTFSVNANGNTALSYQWQVSVNGGVSWSNTGTPSLFTLMLNAVTLGMSGNQYRVIVSDTAGSITSSAATLTVNPPPAVQNISLSISGNATINGNVTIK